MIRDSSIIPKIIFILGFLSVVGIILLFFWPNAKTQNKAPVAQNKEKLFARIILAGESEILRLWERGDRYLSSSGMKLSCPDEILLDTDQSDIKIGPHYYRCQPHLWQCYWSGGIIPEPRLAISFEGQVYHLRAKASFPAIAKFSTKKRFYEIIHGPIEGMNLHHGVRVDLVIDELEGLTWPIILTDTCRDVYLPQRVYGHGNLSPKINHRPEGPYGFLWDNFNKYIFIDKFYVSNQKVNEWRVLTGELEKIENDRKKWPLPAILSLNDQKSYCSFFGKKLLEAKLFDAASMTPFDLKNPLSSKVLRPATPWQRDIGKSFIGQLRTNPDYQLTPLDCELAEVEGCRKKYFFSDSSSWMGMNYSLGFYPESLLNTIEPEKNLKKSSRFIAATDSSHELGVRDFWKGDYHPDRFVAFRCYEDVSP